MNADQYSPYGAGKLAGAAEERERIIKLLVNHLLDESIWKPRTELEKNRKEFYARGIQNAIALIKGENK